MKRTIAAMLMMIVLLTACSTPPKGEKIGTATISISCKTILNNLDNLDTKIKPLVPDDGILFETTQTDVYEDDTAFTLLERVGEQNKIEVYYTGQKASAYIAGIGGITEFCCGAGSGWKFKANGLFPSFGVSQQEIKDGDIIEFLFTCDLGNDL